LTQFGDFWGRLLDRGTAHTWDANGNLLNDGVNTYAYNPTNRLVSVNGSTTYAYNGLGDWLIQNGIEYTLDLNAGLTQVLSGGTNAYTYGLGRISQQSGTTSGYFLGDALGSVRQIMNQAGAITGFAAYDPYGVVTGASGPSVSEYGYTGEQTDPTGMVYLRVRYNNPT